MKKLMNEMRSIIGLIVSTMKECSQTLDDVNTAWREGKALEQFELTMGDRHPHEARTDVALDETSNDAPSSTVNVVLVTEGLSSRSTLFKIKRTMENTNRRFGTRLTTRIIQRPLEVKAQRVA